MLFGKIHNLLGIYQRTYATQTPQKHCSLVIVVIIRQTTIHSFFLSIHYPHVLTILETTEQTITSPNIVSIQHNIQIQTV